MESYLHWSVNLLRGMAVDCKRCYLLQFTMYITKLRSLRAFSATAADPHRVNARCLAPEAGYFNLRFVGACAQSMLLGMLAPG